MSKNHDKDLKILIIEDDGIDKRLLERLLTRSSLPLSEVKSVGLLRDALDLVESEAFDLILSDLGLPDSTGTTVIEELNRVAPHMPVIVMSGQDDEEFAVNSVQFGAQDYLIKGEVNSAILERAIRYAIERKKAEQKLQVAEQNYRIIFENSAVAIMMVNEAGQLVSWNQFTANLLEMTDKDLHLCPIERFYPEEEWQKIRAQKIRLKGMQHHLETRMVKKTGAIIDVDISLTVLKDHEGHVSGSIGVIRDITERKVVEEQLGQSCALLSATLEATDDGLLAVDNEGRVTVYNQKFLAMWGLSKEVLDKTCFDELMHLMADQLLERDAFLTSLGGRGMPQRADQAEKHDVIVFNDGKIYEQFVKPQTVAEKITGQVFSFRDVTERRRVHEVLNRKQKNLEAIFDAAPVGMFLIGSDMKILRANEAARALAFKEYAEIVNQYPGVALGCVIALEDPSKCGNSPECRQCKLFSTIQSSLTQNKAIHGIEINPDLTLNGKPCNPWLSLSTEVLMIDSECCVVVAINDITERVLAEKEITHTMEMKSQFISTVSHELRTPLAAMKEAVLIVLDGVSGTINQDQKRFLGVADRNIDRLWRLINDVLDFQKLNAGKMIFQMAEANLVKTVEEVFQTMMPLASKGKVQMVLDIQADAPLAVYDSDRMIQALTNLTSNAIKFTPEGGRVFVGAKCVGQEFVLTVRDTGLGIPKEDLSKVFDRFYRVHRPGKQITGTGLGLPIVNRIVKAHHGRIEIQSEVDEGTTVTIFLPIKIQEGPRVLSDVEDQIVEKTIQVG